MTWTSGPVPKGRRLVGLWLTLLLASTVLPGCSMLGLGHKHDPPPAEAGQSPPALDGSAGAGAPAAAEPPADAEALIQQQLAPNPDMKPLAYQEPTLWSEVYRLGQWFPGEATSDSRWVSTTGTEQAWYGTMIQSLLSNVLVLPLLLVVALGLLLLFQRLHKLATVADQTQQSLDTVREQMAIPER